MKNLINAEQLEAMQQDAANRNPNKMPIQKLLDQRASIDSRITALRSDEEKELALRSFYATAEDSDKMASQLNDRALATFVNENILSEMDTGTPAYAALSELLSRFGFPPDQEN